VADNATIGHAQPQLCRAHGKDGAGATHRQSGIIYNLLKLSEDRSRVMTQYQINVDFADGQNVKDWCWGGHELYSNLFLIAIWMKPQKQISTWRWPHANLL